MTTITTLLARAATARPHEQAYVDERGGALVWAECVAAAQRIAQAIRARGIHPGARVALVFGNRDALEFVCATYGVILARCVAVPISDGPRSEEVAAITTAADAVLAILGSHSEAQVPGGQRWSALADRTATTPQGWDWADADPDDAVCVVYSTGTTGLPRGVEISHANMLIEPCPPRRSPLADTLVHAFPVGSAAALSRLWAPLRAPIRVLTLATFAPGVAVRQLDGGRVAGLALVPAMAELLLAHPRAADAVWPSVSSIVLTGAPIGSADLCERLAAHAPAAEIEIVYGSTEAGPARLRMVADPSRPRCVGRPEGDSEVRVVGSDGAPVPVGALGQVLLRSPGRPQRRYATAAADDAVFRRDGWVATGDVGWLGEDGCLTLAGRVANVINIAGHKVLADTIEAILCTHPAVAAAVAWGVADDLLGERLEVAVLSEDPALAPEDVLGFARRELPREQWPSRCHLAAELPRSVKGDVLRSAVIARYRESSQPA